MDQNTQINRHSEFWCYGEDLSIRELAETVAETAGFKGTIEWDRSKPDGTPRKLMDSSRIRALGWKPHTTMREGLRAVAALVEHAELSGH